MTKMHWGKNTFDGSSVMVDESRLGMEARSIYKSIKTEEAKLIQYSNPTRSDLHYFRARFNYYRLSLLRLNAEEKALLEPVLSQFLDRIVRIEGGEETSAPPFLEAVETQPEQEANAAAELVAEAAAPASKPVPEPQVYQPKKKLQPGADLSVKEQLKLIQMALRVEASEDGNTLISKSLQAVIDRIED